MNPNHDELGRFSEGDGGGGMDKADHAYNKAMADVDKAINAGRNAKMLIDHAPVRHAIERARNGSGIKQWAAGMKYLFTGK